MISLLSTVTRIFSDSIMANKSGGFKKYSLYIYFTVACGRFVIFTKGTQQIHVGKIMSKHF